MNVTAHEGDPAARGILVRGNETNDANGARHSVLGLLDALDLTPHVMAETGADGLGPFVRLWLNEHQTQTWAPNHDTLQLCETLHLDPLNQPADQMREIVVSLLMGPVTFEFPSLDELASAVRIRRNIVQAARKTSLAFHTRALDRPLDCWTHDEDRGFTIRPGVSLITALTKATQPEVSGSLYAFSCYRASEYVMLLGIAQELETSNPALLQQLQTMWTTRPIASGEFHDVFLREQGSMDAPLPPRYFVPGDRTWFRNPDEPSADASGFEGSWVMYLGGGLFTNFWKHDQPYTLTRKCVEIYHWRHGLYRDENGDERINEARIEPLIEAALNNPAECQRILAVMERYREPRGVYTEAGGCIDTTREFARWVRPGTADLVLPAQ
ncbi:MAG: hypothetical protein ABI606_15760 [Rhodoferax sp.]